jgi:D-alanyl-D-alanine carboxypeptidase/D-alanyl-D-alanine-endopeptidase (penicillin-binding protein 4)
VDDTVWSYGAAVSAIAVNDNAMTLTVTPAAAAGAPLTFDLRPWSGFYHVQSDAMTTRAGTEAQLRISREPESQTLVLGGTMPAGAPPRPLVLAVPQPAEHAAALLLQVLEARGVHVSGSSKGRHAAEVAAQCCAALPVPAVLAQHLSPPLLQDVQATNKLSLNLHAEMMLRVAAKEKGNAQIMDDALKFAEQFRQSAGIATDDVQLTDGSGLSRSDLATPQSVVQLLTWATRQKWGADFAASLPVAGQDGTLENRMKGTAAAGRVHAKTGLVEHVEGLSGYATTVRGEHLIFSVFGNNQGIHSRDATGVVDALCVAMVEEFGSTPATPAASGSRQR